METLKTSTALETGEKVSIVGESAVGKSSICKMYTEEKF
jgi:ABC-type protease/lipase transport system fused ATPase/permease subunit